MSESDTDRTQYDEFLTEQLAQLRATGEGTSKILLIKRLRQQTGLGLKEAKEVVDDFCARNCPELYPKTTALARCVNIAAALTVVAAILWILWSGGRAWPKDWRDPVGWVIVLGIAVVWLTSRRPRQAVPSPLGQHDDLLTAELETLRQQGHGDRAYILLIKRLRQKTGLGLKQGKDVVDEFRQSPGL